MRFCLGVSERTLQPELHDAIRDEVSAQPDVMLAEIARPAGRGVITRSDRELLAVRRGNANRLGFAVQLALLRHPGMGLAHMEEPVDALVAWLARRLEIPAAAFAEYAGRAQTRPEGQPFGRQRPATDFRL